MGTSIAACANKLKAGDWSGGWRWSWVLSKSCRYPGQSARDFPFLMLGLLALLWMPFWLSGAFRFLFSVSLSIGLTLGLGVTAPLMFRTVLHMAAGVRAAADANRLWGLWLTTGAMLLPGVYAVWCLWISDFSGLPTTFGWDAGTHIYLFDEFVETVPQAYNGFVFFYAAAHWLVALFGLTVNEAFGAAFLAPVFIYSCLPVLCTLTALDRSAQKTAWGNAATMLLIGIVWWYLLDRVCLPVFHYIQGMGYYPQAMTAFGLAALWAVDVSARGFFSRLMGFTLGLAALRFGYGLHLPDALVALAAVFALPIGGFVWWKRLIWGLGSGACLLAANLGYQKLMAVIGIPGGIFTPNLDYVLRSQLMIWGALLVGALWGPLNAFSRVRPGILRVVRFPLAFCFAGYLGFLLFRIATPKVYYVTKYQYALVLALMAVVPVVAGRLISGLLSALWAGGGVDVGWTGP